MTDLKSIEPITDPEQILAVLAKQHHPHTHARMGEDGRVLLSKQGQSGSGPDMGAAEIKALVEARGMPWSEEYAERTVPYWGSDERVDGHGDIVRQSWIFDEFEKNSPMPVSHQWQMPPVGRVIDWRVMTRKEQGYNGKALWLLGLFATKADWEWADTIFRLIKSKILVAGSVGFWSAKVMDIKDPKERETLGLGRYGLIFEDNHLLEFSPTTIPANSGATIAASLEAAKHKGLLLPHDLTMLRELKREELVRERPANTRERWMQTESMLIELGRKLWPDEAFEVHTDIDVPVTLDNPPVPRPHGKSVQVDLSSLATKLDAMGETQAQLVGQVASLTARVEAALDALDDQNPSEPPAADTGGAATPAAKQVLATELATLIRQLEVAAKPST